MMRPKGVKRFFYALLVIGVLTIMSAPRIVLCIGTDGHVALESTMASCCPDAAHEAGLLRADKRCASECTDAELGCAVVTRPVDWQHASDAPPMVAVIGHVPVLSDVRRVRPVASVETVPLAPPREKRTTIYLC